MASGDEDTDFELIELARPWLDAEACERLNGLFYGAHPDRYFETRLHFLMIEAARPEVRREAVTEGIEWRKLSFKSLRDPDEDAETHSAFVYAEAANLLHHTGETLLRVYLGTHQPRRDCLPCPWVETAEERLPGAFKERVRDRFDGAELDDARRGEIETVFYRSRALLEPEELAELDGSIEEIESWLTKAARRFLDEAELFNAIKHGLAIQASESAFSIGTPEQKISHEGPAVNSSSPLTRSRRRAGRARWISPRAPDGRDVVPARAARSDPDDRSFALPGRAHRVASDVPAGRPSRPRVEAEHRAEGVQARKYRSSVPA